MSSDNQRPLGRFLAVYHDALSMLVNGSRNAVAVIAHDDLPTIKRHQRRFRAFITSARSAEFGSDARFRAWLQSNDTRTTVSRVSYGRWTLYVQAFEQSSNEDCLSAVAKAIAKINPEQGLKGVDGLGKAR